MTPTPVPLLEALDHDGYALVPAALSAARVAELIAEVERLWELEGPDAGVENYREQGVRRLANLAAKGEAFRALAVDPLVLDVGRHVCRADLRLSMLNARDVPAGAAARQPWHCDTDGGAARDERGALAFTAVWWLDRADAGSGGTRIIPGSHRRGSVPGADQGDPSAPSPGEVVVEAAAGDLLLFDGHCWHTGGANTSDRPRRAILAHYFRVGVPRRSDRRPHLGPEVALDERQHRVFGLDEP